MSIHIFGAILTADGCAANNRGETEGNITTLQKLLWKGQVHSTVSAEAIRWALRYYWQTQDVEVNRKWHDERDDHEWQDAKWGGWAKQDGKTYIDDDVLGYMKAEGSRTEGEKGSALKRRGVLEVSRAISTLPYAGDISFNAHSGAKGRTSLYGTEMHCTRYQYGFAMTPERLREKARCLTVIDGLISLGEVAGNHSRFLFDFSPESVIFRITEDPAPRILYTFQEQNGNIVIPELLRKIESGDIAQDELYIGGSITQSPELASLATCCCKGVKEAATKLKEEMKKKLPLEKTNG